MVNQKVKSLLMPEQRLSVNRDSEGKDNSLTVKKQSLASVWIALRLMWPPQLLITKEVQSIVFEKRRGSGEVTIINPQKIVGAAEVCCIRLHGNRYKERR